MLILFLLQLNIKYPFADSQIAELLNFLDLQSNSFLRNHLQSIQRAIIDIGIIIFSKILIIKLIKMF